jgi:RNA polymerase sigma-70 factor (ECF subfamily)
LDLDWISHPAAAAREIVRAPLKAESQETRVVAGAMQPPSEWDAVKNGAVDGDEPFRAIADCLIGTSNSSSIHSAASSLAFEDGAELPDHEMGVLDVHMSDESHDSLPTRKTLLERLKDADDRDSWQEFFSLYHGRVYRFALQRGMTPQEAEDVVQETFLCVTKKMPHFHYDSSKGKFRSWLLHLARWRIGDEYKKRGRLQVSAPSADAPTETDPLERIADPSPNEELEGRIDKEWRLAVLEVALERVKGRVNAKQFQAYDLYAVKGWPAAKVALTLGMNSASVHLHKHRISKLIKQEIKALDKEKI